MKKCPKCEKELLEDEFSKNKCKKDGLSTYCKFCTKSYRNASYQKKREYYIAKNKNYKQNLIKDFREFRSNLSCMICGEDHPATLDFHHRDPKQKEFSIAKISRGYSKEKLKKELDKCDVLCSNCHRKLHYSLR
jgi:hypothetical protein